LNFKKMGKNLLWGILTIIFVWWLWRWVQGQGGILAVFNRAFPGTVPDRRHGKPVVPLHPEMPPNIGLNDKLPWENNRRRGEVINALKADIARITRYSREVANTFTEVARVGGVDNYLSMQRERLTRARTLPSFVGPIGAVAQPAFAAQIGGKPAAVQPVILPFTGQVIDHSPLTPVPVFEILPNRPHVSGGGNISLMQGGLAFIQD